MTAGLPDRAADREWEPSAPSFEQLLRDPNEQFDRKSVPCHRGEAVNEMTTYDGSTSRDVALAAVRNMAADWYCPFDATRPRIDCPECIAAVALDAYEAAEVAASGM
ncbi:MAG TPA: hypothetical protein VFH56_16045, partial [Acidimicrobiales bacterium]|nr:hypothetical protein [Acidimicrobiales bacterium]